MYILCPESPLPPPQAGNRGQSAIWLVYWWSVSRTFVQLNFCLAVVVSVCEVSNALVLGNECEMTH
jgi:hypothetical protein